MSDSRNYPSSERRLANNQYESVIDLVRTYYPNNFDNFKFLGSTAFNRLSTSERWKEVLRVTQAFNSPW